MKMFSLFRASALAVLFTVVFSSAPSVLVGQPPSWWQEFDVVSDQPADDYAVINQGQLKNLALKSYLAMESKLPGGAGPELGQFIDTFFDLNAQIPVAGSDTDDFASANLGQLKNVASHFYQRLEELQLANGYPWSGSTDDYAIANIGQAKNLFAFDLDEFAEELVPSLEIISGNGQTVAVGQVAGSPVVVKAALRRKSDGAVLEPLGGRQINFSVQHGSAQLSADGISFTVSNIEIEAAPNGSAEIFVKPTGPDANAIIIQANVETLGKRSQVAVSINAVAARDPLVGLTPSSTPGTGSRDNWDTDPDPSTPTYQCRSDDPTTMSLIFTPQTQADGSQDHQIVNLGWFYLAGFFEGPVTIERRVDSGPWIVLVNQTSDDSYQDTGLKYGPRYQYRVTSTQCVAHTYQGAYRVPAFVVDYEEVAHSAGPETFQDDDETGPSAFVQAFDTTFNDLPFTGHWTTEWLFSPYHASLNDFVFEESRLDISINDVVPDESYYMWFDGRRRKVRVRSYPAEEAHMTCELKWEFDGVPNSEQTLSIGAPPTEPFDVNAGRPGSEPITSFYYHGSKFQLCYFRLVMDNYITVSVGFGGKLSQHEYTDDAAPLGKGDFAKIVIEQKSGDTFKAVWDDQYLNVRLGGVFPITSGQIVTGTGCHINFTEDAPIGHEGSVTFFDSEGTEIGMVNLINWHDGNASNEGPNVFSFSGDETAPPEYRKISLTGLPLSDSSPKAQEETDQEPESTYVDAMTLGLRHSVTDFYLPIPGSDLAVQVRRNVATGITQSRSGLRFHERDDLPFGPGWDSNLGAGAVLTERFNPTDNKAFLTPDTLTLTDENGVSYTFLVYWERTGPSTVVRKYFLQPSSRYSQETNMVKLTTVPLSGGKDGYKLVRKHGTSLIYEMLNDVDDSGDYDKEIAADRIRGSVAKVRYKYGRLISVTDRLGMQLVYSYSGESLVPTTISAKNSTGGAIPGFSLGIDQNSAGRVTQVRDSLGRAVTYTYGSNLMVTYQNSHNELSKQFSVLSKVTNPDGYFSLYGYEGPFEEEDATPILAKNGEFEAEDDPDDQNYFYHLNVSSITDPLGRVYGFQYGADSSKKAFHILAPNNSFTQTGLPRKLTSIVLPSQSQGPSFVDHSNLQASAAGASYSVTGVKQTVITDAEGVSRTYTWTNMYVEELLSPGPGYLERYEETELEDHPWNTPKLVHWQMMTIATPAGNEVYEFDLAAGLALKKATDICGNIREYSYANSASASFAGFREGNSTIATKSNDPTMEKRYLVTPGVIGTTALEKHFQYASAYQILDRTEEPFDSGTTKIVDYDVDPASGLREVERISVTDSEGTRVVQETEFLYENAAFPGTVTRQTVKTLGTSSDPGWVEPFVTTYQLNARGLIESETVVNADGPNLITSYIYDAVGNKVSVTDPNGNETRFFYDERNRLTRTVFADGTDRHLYYDKRGNKVMEIDERGQKAVSIYDSLNRVIHTGFDDGDAIYTESGVTGFSRADAGDIVTSFEYNDVGSKTAEIGPGWETGTPVSHQTVFEYDSVQRLDAVTNALGHTTRYYYDAEQNCGGSIFDISSFKPTRIVDEARGYQTFTTYDSLYRPVETHTQYMLVPAPGATPQSQPGQFASTTTVYTYLGHPTQVTDPLGKVTSMKVDVLGRTTKTTFHDETFVSSKYTSTGLAWEVTDELGRATVTEYDFAGRPMRVIAPAVTLTPGSTPVSPISQMTYDLAGNVIQTTDPLGRKTDFVYDSRNRQVQVIAPEVYDAERQGFIRPTTSTVYDAAGNVVAVYGPRGDVSETVYDFAGRPVTSMAPPAPTVGPAIDSAGSVALANGQFSADWRAITRTEYNRAGNIWKVTDPKGNQTVNEYDELNRLTRTTQGNIVNVFAYDPAGNRTHVWDGEQVVRAGGNPTATAHADYGTVFEYDGLNRLVKTVQPAHNSLSLAERTSTQKYDAVNQIEKIDAKGQHTEYTYDDRHRLEWTIFKDASGAGIDRLREYKYDDAGNLELVDELGTLQDVEYTYDELNRLTSERSGETAETSPQIVTHTYGYDLVGNRISTKYGVTELAVATEYDALNRPVRITEGGRVTQLAYNAAGGLAVKQLANGEQTEMAYDALGRVLDIRGYAAGSMANTTYVFSHKYDAVGNLVWMGEDYTAQGGGQALPDRELTLEYDGLNRLVAESVASGGSTKITTYGYDKANNRTVRVNDAGGSQEVEWEYLYNERNQLHTALKDDGGASSEIEYTYDLNGNREQRFADEVPTHGYQWDFENRLRVADLTQTQDVYRFLYDYRARRVYRDYPQGITHYSFSGGVSVQEWQDAADEPELEYVRGPDLGGGVRGILYNLDDAETARFLHYNARGDVTRQSDAQGGAAYQAAYEAFGTRPNEIGTAQGAQRANTKDEESALGLLNEGFRYRDMETGTFLSADPLGFIDGPNVYAYVRQNPWSKFDPLGLRTDDAGFEWADKDHHKVPVEVGSKYWTDDGAKEVLDRARIETPNGHNYSKHGRVTGYSGHVEAELQSFMNKRGIDSIGDLSARDQRELAEAFVKQIDTTPNKFIRGFNKAVKRGPEGVKQWWTKKGQHLPGPKKIGSIEFRPGKLGNSVPFLNVGIGVAMFTTTFAAQRAEGYGLVDSLARTTVETVNPTPFSVEDYETALQQADYEYEQWKEQGQANIINKQYGRIIGEYTTPEMAKYLEQQRDGTKLDPSR